LGFVSNHPATTEETRGMVGNTLDKFRASFPASLIDEGLARGEALSLSEVIDQALNTH